MKPMPFVYKNGAVAPIEEAKVSLASHSLQYGSTCFTGMRGYVRRGHVRLLRLREHFARLTDAVKILGWKCPLTFGQFSNALKELIQKNRPEQDFYIRPFLLTESEELRIDYTHLTFDLAIYLVPFGALFDPKKGLNLKISSWKRVSDSSMASKAKAGGCYINSCLAHTDARREGYDDAILMNEAGQIAELSGANLLAVYKGRVLTPPAGSDILDGITLRSCIEILASEGIEVIETPLDRSMLYGSEEIIAAGTAAQIQFAKSVDGRSISEEGPGPVCQLLRRKMDAIINKEDERFAHWITEWPIAPSHISASQTPHVRPCIVQTQLICAGV